MNKKQLHDTFFLLFCLFNKTYIAEQYFPRNQLTMLREEIWDRVVSHQSAPGVKGCIGLAPIFISRSVLHSGKRRSGTE